MPARASQKREREYNELKGRFKKQGRSIERDEKKHKNRKTLLDKREAA